MNLSLKIAKPKFIVLENEKVYKKNKRFLNKFKNKIVLIEPSENFIDYKEIISHKDKQIKKIS